MLTPGRAAGVRGLPQQRGRTRPAVPAGAPGRGLARGGPAAEGGRRQGILLRTAFLGSVEIAVAPQLGGCRAQGPSFKVEAQRVEWQQWDLRVGFNGREGLVLYDVSAARDLIWRSGGIWRSGSACCRADPAACAGRPGRRCLGGFIAWMLAGDQVVRWCCWGTGRAGREGRVLPAVCHRQARTRPCHRTAAGRLHRPPGGRPAAAGGAPRVDRGDVRPLRGCALRACMACWLSCFIGRAPASSVGVPVVFALLPLTAPLPTQTYAHTTRAHAH